MSMMMDYIRWMGTSPIGVVLTTFHTLAGFSIFAVGPLFYRSIKRRRTTERTNDELRDFVAKQEREINSLRGLLQEETVTRESIEIEFSRLSRLFPKEIDALHALMHQTSAITSERIEFDPHHNNSEEYDGSKYDGVPISSWFLWHVTTYIASELQKSANFYCARKLSAKQLLNDIFLKAVNEWSSSAYIYNSDDMKILDYCNAMLTNVRDGDPDDLEDLLIAGKLILLSYFNNIDSECRDKESAEVFGRIKELQKDARAQGTTDIDFLKSRYPNTLGSLIAIRQIEGATAKNLIKILDDDARCHKHLLSIAVSVSERIKVG